VIQRSVKIQILVFSLIGLLAVAYAGIQYVGLGVLINKPYRVTAFFASSGGIFTNAEVTDRGVGIGKVGELKLTPQGVAVELLIDKGRQVPKDTDAVVANLSFVGEQYVDLQPHTASGPMLRDGDTVPVQNTRTPLPDAQFLLNLDRLANSVNKDDLRVVVDELGKATDGLGPTLQRLIDRGNSLTETVTANLPQQLQLIRQGKQVLDTANATSAQFRESSKRLESNLPILLANLITLGQVQALRLPALKQLLVTYPEDIRNGFLNAPGDGTSHFGIVSDNNAPVCTTGYEATRKRTGEDRPSDVPANTGAYCNLPVTSPTDVHGSRNAPRPPGDRTDPALQPGRAAAGASTDGSADVPQRETQLVSYDPLTQVVAAPDGSSIVLQRMNGNADLYPGGGWKDLILGPLSNS